MAIGPGATRPIRHCHLIRHREVLQFPKQDDESAWPHSPAAREGFRGMARPVVSRTLSIR